jgi:hypothetical protein
MEKNFEGLNSKYFGRSFTWTWPGFPRFAVTYLFEVRALRSFGFSAPAQRPPVVLLGVEGEHTSSFTAIDHKSIVSNACMLACLLAGRIHPCQDERICIHFHTPRWGEEARKNSKHWRESMDGNSHRGSVAVVGHDEQHSMPGEEVTAISNGKILYGAFGQRERTLRLEPCRRILLHAGGGRRRSVDSLGLGEGQREVWGEGRRSMV